MKPAPFGYHAPQTLDEALGLLAAGGDVRPLAGGQSLVPLLKLRELRPDALVDLNGVAGLDAIEEVDGGLRIGALVRQQALLDDALVARLAPLVPEAVQHVGFRATRHRGTVGGSLAHAAPWAELPAVAVALDAAIELRAAGGSRTLPARAFFRGANATALAPGELVTALRIPAPAPGLGWGWRETSPRYRDYAEVGAAATVVLDGGGGLAAAEVVLVRVAGAPLRLETAPLVAGVDIAGALDRIAAAIAAIEPSPDVHVSAAFRRRVAPVLARRALGDAIDRAQGGSR